MGVLNVTPDSFSDGGRFLDSETALKQAEKMLHDGADIIDIGAESSAPGSEKISVDTEWSRLSPVLSGLLKVKKKNIRISIDTWKSAIGEQAIALGADMINDVTAFRGDPQMWQLAKTSQAKFVVMYSKDNSARTTMTAVTYDDPLQTIIAFFREFLARAEKQNIDPQRFILDPGMGAFLSADPNVSLVVLRRLQELKSAFPDNKILIGTSRKGFLRVVSGQKIPKQRLIASVVSALIAAQNGADILRVHDVQETREALDTDFLIKNAH